MTRRISIANQKGGVGKTTTAVNIGASLATLGKNVLLIDVDPQGNVASGLGVEVGERPTIHDVLLDKTPLSSAIAETTSEGLYVVPSSPAMVAAERELITGADAPFRLRQAVEKQEGFDFILFDTPPSLGILTINAMLASESVIIPVQAEYYALEGLTQLLSAVEYVRDRLRHPIRIEGFVLTMFDSRTRLAGDVEAQVRQHFGDLVYETIIPRNVRLSEAPSHGLPVIDYALASRGAQSYLALTNEILNETFA